MRIRTIYGITAIAGAALLSGATLKNHDNALKNNYSNRIQDMKYVKQNNFNKYMKTLEIVNKTNSPRISPEYIDNIWETAAKAVSDSINLTKGKKG